MANIQMLLAEWRDGTSANRDGWLAWSFNSPVKVEGFEIERAGGMLSSVMVGSAEQLAVSPLPIAAVVTHYKRNKILSSPFPGMKIGPLVLETVLPGWELRVQVADFAGRVRPFGWVMR